MSRNTRGLEDHLITLAQALSTSKPKAKAKGNHLVQSVAEAQRSSGNVTLAEEVLSQLGSVAAAPGPAATTTTAPADTSGSEDEAAAKSKQNADLEKLVDSFIDNQSGSDDACHSKLLEARHQLNRLHDILGTLMTEVNSTENSLVLYDKELQEKLSELQHIEAWKADELKKCEEKKAKDKTMFETLTKELKEMHQIASPSTAMNLKNGTVSSQPSQAHFSFLQEHVEAIARDNSLLKANEYATNHSEAVSRIPSLVHSAQDAAHHLRVCIAQHHAQISLLQASQDPNSTSKKGNATSAPSASSQAPASAETCKAQKEALEKTYVKAYVELARLTAEYSELAKSTACEDQVISTYEERAPALQEAAEKLSKLSSETADKLKELRPRLESAVEADKKLRKQVQDLTSECDALPETISDLDKVRDAIGALSLCPGLERPDFKMPTWIGKWVMFSQNAKMQDDTQQDSGMNWACDNEVKGSRAAEASEIMERTILEMPVNNTGDYPVLGACTNCAGDDDTSLKSGHARVCWMRGQPLDDDGKAASCSTGKKVVLCVSDGSSIRKIPGQP
eukprot:gnl/MRDRNA2_/MRDRNA2_128516_c0_seq1.p1 gnl/MRDRNA2_/MRDRNA2_128516_c0~~gnl/MRDRNA2_/MRDRNA2_128516_c0_seq1.p1  ORF type:complete len:637 (+),score=142.09 gnl/MRDRNA2_/MRDRNA2_128516_c0_seq1:215-1912(+)